jgi:nucleoside-diphosphate-sugar epimerase
MTDAVPVDETSPVREERYPYRGQIEGMDDYDKLDVEEVYLEREATVLRLPMVYGPRDGQRREEFILRRVRAGRRRIPIGSGTWLGTKGFVADVARGVRLAIESPDARGEIFNLGESRTYPVGLWARMILEAAGSDAELVTVADDKLPPDLGITGSVRQHLLVDSAKARRMLGWTDTDAREALAISVGWHMANPPEETGEFTADDDALATVASRVG